MTYCEEYPSAAKQARLLADWKDLLNRYDVMLLDTETPHKDSSDVLEIAVINTRHTSRKDPLINKIWSYQHKILIRAGDGSAVSR